MSKRQPFFGVSLPREVLVEETLRLIYDNLIHGRKGIPQHPHVHRIQGKSPVVVEPTWVAGGF